MTSLFYRDAVGSRLRASNGVLISVREKGTRGEGLAFRAAAHYRLVDVCTPALLYINIVPRLVVAVAVVGRPHAGAYVAAGVCLCGAAAPSCACSAALSALQRFFVLKSSLCMSVSPPSALI